MTRLSGGGFQKKTRLLGRGFQKNDPTLAAIIIRTKSRNFVRKTEADKVLIKNPNQLMVNFDGEPGKD